MQRESRRASHQIQRCKHRVICPNSQAHRWRCSFLHFRREAGEISRVLLISLLCLSLVVMPLPLWTQVGSMTGVSTYDMENYSGGIGLGGGYFDVRYQAYHGVGYRNGFTQFGLFVPVWLNDSAFIAGNTRLTLTDNTQTGFNGGLVARLYSAEWDRIFGLNAYYDLDESPNKHNFQQIGFGFETLGESLDARMNGYLPVTTASRFVREAGLTDQLVFFYNRLGFVGIEAVERALAGGDFEVGTPIFASTPWLRAYAGMYFYDNPNDSLSNEDIVGFRGRIEGWVSDDLSIGMIVTTDTAWGTNVNAVADWRFSGFKPTRYFPQFTTAERMLMPVQRNWRVSVREYERLTNVLAYNPRDDQPYFVVWVDNSNPNPGDGTYENPYSTVPATLPSETDLVLVRRGNTTAATPLSGTFNLPNYARLLGEGRVHVVDAYASYGPFSVAVDDAPLPDPAFSNTGNFPFLTSAGNIVNLGQHNEVAALVLTGSGGTAIAGTNTFGFHLHDLEITNNVGGGISLLGARGTGIVTADGQVIESGLLANINTNIVPGWANPFGLGDNTTSTIDISTSSTAGQHLNLVMSNIAANSSAGAQDFGILLQTNTGNLNATLNTISASGNFWDGIVMFQTPGGGAISAQLANITADGNGRYGLAVTANSTQPVSITADQMQANNNGAANAIFRNLGAGNLDVSLTNGTFNNATNLGVIFDAQQGSNAFSLTNVDVSNNGTNGIDITVVGTAAGLNLDLDNVTANGNNAHGLNFQNGSFLLMNVQNSVFSNNSGSGLSGFTLGSALSIVSLTDVDTNDNSLYGIELYNIAGSVSLTGDNITSTGNATNLGLSNTAGANLVASLSNSTFDNGLAGPGIELTNIAGTATVNLTNVSASNNAQEGLNIINDAGTLGIAATNLLANNNGSTNLLIDNSNSSIFSGNFSDSSFDGSISGRGIELQNDASTATINLTTVSSSNNGAHGLYLNNSGGTLTLTATSLTADNNGNTNFYANNTSGALFSIDLINSSFDGSILSAGFVLNADSSVGSANLINSTASSNATYGVFVSAINGSTLGTAPAPPWNGVNIIDSIISGNGIDATHVFVDGGSYLEFYVDPTDLSGSGRHGFRFEVNNGSNLLARFEDVNFDQSGTDPSQLELGAGIYGAQNGRAVFGRVDGLGSTAAVTIVNSTLNQSGDDGVFILSSDNALTNLSVSNSSLRDSGQSISTASSISLVATTGAQISADLTNAALGNSATGGTAWRGLNLFASGLGSLIEVTGTNLNSIQTNDASVRARATNQATVFFDLGQASFSSASSSGVYVEADLGSSMNVCLDNVSFNNNGLDGITIRGLDGGTEINVHLENANFDNNSARGLHAQIDNGAILNLRTVGTSFDLNQSDGVLVEASGGSTAARLLFNTTSANDNLANGFRFLAQGGATLTAQLDSISAQNNALYGVRLDAQDAGTAALLLPSGANVILNNGLGAYSVNYTNVGFAIVGLDGSFNGIAGDGVNVNINNAGTALVTLTGDGTDTINSNAGHGVNIQISNTSTAGVLIRGYQSISSNALDGIHVDLSNISNAAAVEIVGPTNLSSNGDDGIEIQLQNVALGTFTAPVGLDPLTILTLVDHDPTYPCVPEPIAVAFSSVVPAPTGNGILIDGMNINSGGVGAAGQDGIHIRGQSVTGSGTIDLTNNSITGFNTGINLYLNPSYIGGLAVENNTITNSNDYGIALVGLNTDFNQISIAANTVNNTTNFDGILAVFNGGSYTTLTAANNSINNTGRHGFYLQTNGAITGNTTLLSSDAGNVTARGFWLNYIGGSATQVLLQDISVDTSGSDGVLVSMQNTTGVNSVVIDGLGSAQVQSVGGQGVTIDLLNVAGTPSLAINGHDLVQNVMGHGLVIQAINTNVNQVDFLDNTVNQIGQIGPPALASDGIRLVLNSNVGDGIPIGLSGDYDILARNNVVSNTVGDSFDYVLDGVTGFPDIKYDGNTVSNWGSGEQGYDFSAFGAQIGFINFDPLTITGNFGAEGIRLALNSTTLSDGILIDQVTVSGSLTNGILVDLTNVTGNANLTMTGPSVVQGSAGSGIVINYNNVANTPNISIDGYTVQNNGQGGIVITNPGTPLGSVSITNSSISNSAGGDGLQAYLSNQISNILIDNVTISQSNASGINLYLNGVTGSPNVTLSNLDISNSGFYGLAAYGLSNSLGNILVDNVSVSDSNQGDGVGLLFSNSAISTITLDDVDTDTSAFHGVLVQLNNISSLANITLSSTSPGPSVITGSTATGIEVNLTNVTGIPNISINGYNVNNTSAGSGVGIFNNGSPVGNVSIGNLNVTNSGGGDGIQAYLSGTVGSITLNQATVDTSSASGINLYLNNVTSNPNVSLSNLNVANSGLYGVAVYGQNANLNNLTINNATVSQSNNGDGVLVGFNTSDIQSAVVDSVNVNQSSLHGIRVNLQNITGLNQVAVTSVGNGAAQSSVQNSALTGILVSLNSVTGTPNVTVDGYNVANSTAGSGVGIFNNGSPVGNVSIGNLNVTNSGGGDGIQAYLSGAVGSITLNQATVDTSSASGINLYLSNVTGSPDIILTNTSVSNSNFYGVAIYGANNALSDILLDNVSSNGSAIEDGLFIGALNGSTVSTVRVLNSSAFSNAKRGIHLSLNNLTGLTLAEIDGPGTVSNSGLEGIVLQVSNIVGTPDLAVNDMTVTNSALRGISIANFGSGMVGTPVGEVRIDGNTVSNSGGDGILTVLRGAVGSVTGSGNSVTNSTRSGIQVNLTNVTGSPDVTLANSTVTTSGDYGIVIFGNSAAIGDVLVDGADVSDSNGFDGIFIGFNNGTLSDSITIRDALVDDSNLAGIRVNLVNESGVRDITIDPGAVTNSGADGILVNLLNAIGLPDITIDGYTVDNSGGNGIAIVTNGSNVSDIRVLNNSVSNSVAGAGILINHDAAFVHFADSIALLNNLVSSSGNNGVDIRLDNVQGTTLVTIDDTISQNNTGIGIVLDASGAQLGNIVINNSEGSGSTTADGIRLDLTASSVNNSIQFVNTSANNNAGVGILAQLSSLTLLNTLSFTGTPGVTLVDGNAADGLAIFLTNNPAITPTLSITGYTLSNNGDDGIVLSQVGSNLGNISFTNNRVLSNTSHGIDLLSTSSAQGTVTFTENRIETNGLNGVNLNQLQDTDTSLDFSFFRNQIAGNTQRGVFINLPSPTGLNDVLNLSFENDAVVNNGREGVLVALNAHSSSNVTANISVMSNDTPVNPYSNQTRSQFNGNGSMGLALIGNNTTDFVLNIGGDGGQNQFNNNGDAGVGVTLQQSATLQVTASNVSFSNNIDSISDLYPLFEGDGFKVVAANTTASNVQFFDSTFGDPLNANTSFMGNARHGFAIEVARNTPNLVVNDITNITFNNIDALANGQDGLNFARSAQANITNVTIENSRLLNNQSDGLEISARSRDEADTYNLFNNRIESNIAHGIRFFLEFDADIITTLNGNQILFNGQDGINATQNADITDNNELTVSLTDNDIRFNGNDGIDVITKYVFSMDNNRVTDNGRHGASFSFYAAGNQVITNNFFNNNGQDGLRYESAFPGVNVQIEDNEMVQNGRNGLQFLHQGVVTLDVFGNTIAENANDGIQLESTGGGLIARIGPDIGSDSEGNSVIDNGGDAIQIYTHGNSSPSANDITIQGNDLSDNGRRGINMVNAGEASAPGTPGVRTALTVHQNLIERNDFEGVYIINTTATAQGQGTNIDNNASLPLLTQTNPTIDPRLALNVTSNSIRSNGENGVAGNFISQLTTGLVLRVGTSDANTLAGDLAGGSWQNNGGFATNLTSGTFMGNVAIGNVVRGGVGANISGNTFSGQFGADVTFQPFLSIESSALTTTAGTWTDNNNNPRDPTDDQFNITTFVQDPLARLDLRFMGNTGDGTHMSRSDNANVFYNNAEPVFKSRTPAVDGNDLPGNPSNTGTIGDDNGPFTSATRRRNATRLAGNAGSFNRPTGIGNFLDVGTNGFLYPGVGASTFRITNTSSTLGFSNSFPGYTTFDITDAVPIGGGVPTGELDFVWETIP